MESVQCGRAALLGLGVSNRALLSLLLQKGYTLALHDKKHPDTFDSLLKTLPRERLRCHFGDAFLGDLTEPLLFRSPSIRPDLAPLCEARGRGAVVTTEADFVLSSLVCPVFGVTGSDGKTTTSSLLAALLSQTGRRVLLGGNIGVPLCTQLDSICPDDRCVMELSSFQLMDAQSAPDVAILTNLSENHLDYHRDMEEYVAAKARIFAHRRCRIAVLNAADARTPMLLEGLRPEVEVRLFGWGQDERLCVACHSGQIFVRGVPYLRCDELPLPGRHNVENVMAALAACYEHLTVAQARAAILSFSGVAHRLQLITVKKGVHYYESSIDSTPTRTLASLAAMERWHGHIHLLLGGYDKHLDYAPLAAPVAKSVKRVYLFGATAQKIAAALGAHPDCPPLYLAKDLGDAIHRAASCAVTDDAVLLSPACASFDAFVNFEARGDYFALIVSQL